jgi:hypothetical protein
MNLTAAELLPGRGGCYRSEKLEHSQQALVALNFKTYPQRQRRRLLAYRRHEPGSGGFPEGAANKVIQPPLPPTLQCARVDLQCLPDMADTCRLQAMNHCRYQHDYQSRIDSPSHEPDRLRRSPPAAILLGATKAVAPVPFRPVTRFTFIIGPGASSQGAPYLPD